MISAVAGGNWLRIGGGVFSRLLLDVVAIADEVDSQLKQAMFSYVPQAETLKSQTARLAG